jgi:Y_Y_Y domain
MAAMLPTATCPPGRYRFQVTACNNDGMWNEAGAVLTFIIAPAYDQTPLFPRIGIGRLRFGGV